MKRRKWLYPLIILIYIFFIMPFIYYRYHHINADILNRLDSELYKAASNLDTLLEEDFHDLWTLDRPLPEKDYQLLKNRLNRYVNNLDIEYVYSMVKRGNSIYFVVSNETEEDIKRGTPSLFYSPYPVPPEDLFKAFETGKIIYRSSYTNIWDSYYSVFIPRLTKAGLQYVLAADIKMEDQKHILNDGVSQLILTILLLLLPIIPFFIILSLQAKNREEDLLTQLYTDSLTGLPNRKKFIRDKELSFQPGTSAIMLDIDSFREINNLFGGQTGDRVLRHTAEILKSHCGSADVLYKFPADEFVILVMNRDRREIQDLTARMLQAFSDRPFLTKGQSLSLSISAGIVFEPESQRKLLSSANIAKNQAKRDRKGYVLYEESMNLEDQYSMNYFWLNSLKDALLEERILPYYQPIYHNHSGCINKFEALVRLIDKDGNAVTPDKFLPVAKRSKLYKQITFVMVKKVFQDFMSNSHRVTINLSVRDLLDDDTISYLLEMVEEYQMQDRLVVELLESESLLEMDNLISLLCSLRRKGNCHCH